MQLKLASPLPLTTTLLSLSLISGVLADPCKQGLSYCGSTLEKNHGMCETIGSVWSMALSYPSNPAVWILSHSLLIYGALLEIIREINPPHPFPLSPWSMPTCD